MGFNVAKLFYRLMYVVIALSYIRRICMRSGILTPEMNIVPSGFKPAYSRICNYIMRYIRKTAC